MEAVATIVLPVFGLIAIGFLAVRGGLLPATASDGMGAFMYKIAVPVLVFRAMADADLPETPYFGFWIAYFAGVAGAWAVAEIVARRYGRVGPEAIIAGVSASFSNTVLIGIGLVTRAYGNEGLVPLALLVSIHLPVLGFVITARLEGSGGHIGKTIGKTALALARNPIIIGIVSGTAFNLLGIDIPTMARFLVDPIADAAIPIALITAGVTLSSHLSEGVSPTTVGIIVAKLLIMPAIVFVLVHTVIDLPPLWASVAVLVAAAPTGVNAYLFATPYPRAVPIASAALALSTLLAVATISFWLVILERM